MALPVNIELTTEQKKDIELLINYIATTPRNTNYQIVREAIKALVLGKLYNWEALSMQSNENSDSSSLDPPIEEDSA